MQVFSYSPLGYRGQLVSVEVDMRTGIPGTDIIGLPASEVREARERVRVALKNCGFEYPNRRILINLAPADVPKAGNSFDLAIAIAVISVSEQLTGCLVDRVLVVGELRLDGTVAPVRGCISAVDEAARVGIRHFVVPHPNHEEAIAVGLGTVAAARHLVQIPRLLNQLVAPAAFPAPGATAGVRQQSETRPSVRRTLPATIGDYIHLRGNGLFKRALSIAAAGGHHLLVVGPPGAGKSMGISLLPTVMPALGRKAALEVTRIHSLAGEPVPDGGLVRSPPFRAPHHNSSVEGLLGGGRSIRPGEVSLAHRGILFLDEALEFNRPALQGLREPLEKRMVHITRADRSYWYPAGFQLLMAANPCPCGNLGRPDRTCLCSLQEVDRYWRRIGGPLLDRIDLRVAVTTGDIESLPVGDSSESIRAAVHAARQLQSDRAAISGVSLNAGLAVSRLFQSVRMNDRARRTFTRACSRIRLSARASVSVARVSRTIADLEQCEVVCEDHVLEAVGHRRNGEDLDLWIEP